MSKQEAIEFAIIGGICVMCVSFVFGGLAVALLIDGVMPWL